MVIPIFLLVSLLVFPASATDYWSKPRPSEDTTYDQIIESADNDGRASVGIGVHIWKYEEEFYPQEDVLTLRVSTSANTRVGIEYDINQASYGWINVSQPTGITQNDNGTWLDLPFYFIFYGVQYDSVWVCSNGFLSFDSEYPSHVPQSIPNTNKPNSLIAPFWRDLDPQAGGSITYGIINEAPGRLFIISWNNIPNYANGVPQSFQVVIAELNTYVPDILKEHNRIWFNYKSITKDNATTVGVEDQVGDRGSSYDYHSLSSGSSLLVEYPDPGYRLSRLTIKLSKNDGNAIINILRSENDTGGYNVILENPSWNLAAEMFKLAIEGAATVLIAEPHAAIMFGIILITTETGLLLAEALSPPVFDADDAETNDDEAYVTSVAESEEPLPYWSPFDATLATNVLWRFTDANTMSHSLTITSEVEYYDIQTYSAFTISTSVSLNMYARAHGGGGGGCPTLFVWDGSQYVEETLLDIHADSDVTLQHPIAETLVPDKNSYKLSLRELDNFTSHIDQVNLYVAGDDEMLETHLTKSVHSELGDVKELLLHDDDARVDLTPEQTIDLEFTVPNIEDVCHFVFEINGYNQKTVVDPPI